MTTASASSATAARAPALPHELPLHEWLRDANLIPGVREWKLTRLAPADHQDRDGERVSCSGLTDHGHALISEDYIGEKWGGHTWLVEIFERGEGGERRVSQRQVSIGGPPVAYVFGKRRVAFDPDDDPWEARRFARRRGGANGRSDGLPDGYGYGPDLGGAPFGSGYDPALAAAGFHPDPLSNDPRANAIAGLQNIATRREAQNADTLKAVAESIERAAQSSQGQVSGLITDLRATAMNSAQAASGPALAALKAVQDQLGEVSSRYQALIESMRGAHEEALRNQRTAFDSVLERERQQYQAELARVRDDRRHEVEQIDARWQAVVTAKERDLVGYRDEANRYLTDLRERQRTELADLRERHRAELESVQRDGATRLAMSDGSAGMLLKVVEQERDRLRGEVESLRAEVTALREKANPDIGTQVASIVALKTNLDEAFGGGKKDEPEDGLTAMQRALLEKGSDTVARVADAAIARFGPPSGGRGGPGGAQGMPQGAQGWPQGGVPQGAIPANIGWPQGAGGQGQAGPAQTRGQAGHIRTRRPPQAPAPAQAPAQTPAQVAQAAQAPPPQSAQEQAQAEAEAPPPLDPAAIAAREEAVANSAARVEQFRIGGMDTRSVIAMAASLVPPEAHAQVLNDFLALDVDQVIEIAARRGVDSIQSPAARAFWNELKVTAAQMAEQMRASANQGGA